MDNLVNLSISDNRYVIKRSGDKVMFESEKITRAILKAMLKLILNQIQQFH